jgi:hypothetical protein
MLIKSGLNLPGFVEASREGVKLRADGQAVGPHFVMYQ